jgi:hypothetical protein
MKLSIAALLLSFACVAVSEELPQAGASTLTAVSGEVRVKVFVERVRNSPNCSLAVSWRWGGEGFCPGTVVGGIDVRVGEGKSFIPMSAFVDLGDPGEVRIGAGDAEGRFAIVLHGGEASTSYEATLEFEGNLLRERIVRHGEFPSEAWERTTYKFNTSTR